MATHQIREIKQLIDAGEYEIAAKEIDLLLASCKGSESHLKILKGLCFKALNEWHSMEQAFVEAMLEGALTPKLFLEVALAQVKQQKFVQLGETIRDAKILFPPELLGTTDATDMGKLCYYGSDKQGTLTYLSPIKLSDLDIVSGEMLAKTLIDLGRPNKAAQIYSELTTRTAVSAQTTRNAGLVFMRVRDYNKAREFLENAMRNDRKFFEPNFLRYVCSALFCLEDADEYGRLALLQLSERPSKIVDPHGLIFFSDDPLLLKTKAQDYYSSLPTPEVHTLLETPKLIEGSRIIVGYMSADFKNHATSYLIDQLIKNHNRKKFFVVAIDFSVETSNHGNKVPILSFFDQVVSITELSDREAAYRIHDLGIHILIDLKGHTEASRPAILKYKPAPIQINWLGYPGSIGGAEVDYIIGDRVVTPLENSKHFTEKIIQLPCCYQPNRPYSAFNIKTQKQDHDLPEQSFVFCCFNNHWKLTTQILQAWSNILNRCPNSVLWLLKPLEFGAALALFERFGIARNRLVFAKPAIHDHHLERIRHADLFLDTFPCGAHTTASDAIRANVPVLTILGKSFHARVSASVVKHAGLDDFVCKDLNEYEIKAELFFQNRDLIEDARAKLARADAKFHPLKLEVTVEYLEKAMERIVKTYPEVTHQQIEE